MSDINVLPKEIAELIAAGEVIERPASVIKELVENSIDAGATNITVEIAHGGITYMRVTDNGCGIKRSEIKTAFLRHATSKIKSAEDLDAILTLGFRGEALASISAVSKVEIMTCTPDDEFGTSYFVSGTDEGEISEIGCPKGTTIIIRDLFYNVPARMKFLKKDVSEANTVAAVLDRIALSHPEVAIKFIRDSKITLTTSGDGKLKSAIYSVLGRDFSSSLIPLEYEEGNVSVSGYVCMPSRCRPNRNGQFFFLNGRYIKSGTISAALDQAYKNSSMVGKFPAGVINLTVPAGTVDVNVHPTKSEVRFSEEKKIFDVVYRGTKQAVLQGDKRPEMKIPDKKPLNIFATTEKFVQVKQDIFGDIKEDYKKTYTKKDDGLRAENEKSEISENKEPVKTYITDFGFADNTSVKTFNLSDVSVFDSDFKDKKQSFNEGYVKPNVNLDIVCDQEEKQEAKENSNGKNAVSTSAEDNSTGLNLNDVQYVGQVFGTYILVSLGDTLYFIDKHAAHERINFEKLKSSLTIQSQMLLTPQSVTLLSDEYDAVINNISVLEKCGFLAEDFGDNSVIIRAVPSILDNVDISSLIREIAYSLSVKGTAVSDRIDDILHSIACKSAIKAGYITSKEEQISLALKVLGSKDLMYCPHGRPIAFEMKKSQIEKQFGRII